MEPNQDRIDSFEHFVLEDCENLKLTQMLKVTISRLISLVIFL